MARFNKMFIKKLYLPDGKDKGQLDKLSRITASASELNKIDGVTATTAELNLNDNIWASFTTATVPAVGTCAVQMVFKDVAGVTMATPVAGRFYMSNVATGLTRDDATSIAVLTNGAVTEMDAAHKAWAFTTTAAGLLGVTITDAADDKWLVFEHPTGKLVISSVCVINA